MNAMNVSHPVREAVREFYAERARSSTSCCTTDGADCCTSDTGFYSDSEIGILPDDVANFSLGCGNAVGGADLRPGETVLDLGSGGGLECFIAAKAVGLEGRVIGVDMTPDMLSRARSAAARLGFENVEFREGYIEAMPVDDETVDVIISNCVINLSPDKPAVMAEMHRVLKPGGRIAISDVVTQSAVPESYQKDLALWSACASGAIPVDEWVQGLSGLGFEEIKIEAAVNGEDWSEYIPESRPFSALIKAVKR